MIWYGLDIFINNYADRSHVAAYHQNTGHIIHLPLYYLACALLWNILMSPIFYYKSCVMGSGPPDHKKDTLSERLESIAQFQWKLFLKVWLFIYLEYGDIMSNTDWKYHQTFNHLQEYAFVYAIWVIMILPFMPARYSVCTPLKTGRTKDALEKLGVKLSFPLNTVFTYPEGQIYLTEWPWKRIVVIPEVMLEKCDTEEVVALVAGELGNWKQNSFLKLAMTFLVCVELSIERHMNTNRMPLDI